MLRIIPVLVALPLLCGCPGGTPSPIDPGGPSGTGIDIQTVVADAAFPAAMAIAPDGRVFYTEKETGRLRVIVDGQLLPDAVLDVPVNAVSERGLLGVALHPDFADNGLVYVYYTRSSTGQDTRDIFAVADNRVVRFQVAGNTATGGETLILTLPATPGPNHNGGNIHFGPDGKLYVSIGDVANSANAQNVNAQAGRILRVNDDGSIPSDNPFGTGNPTYALGVRNSYDFTFDPIGGEIFATENGTNRHDEINRVLAGGNYGWPDVQGRSDGNYTPGVGTYHEPLVDIAEGVVVPTGIAFVPDATFGAEAQGRLVVGEYQTGRIIQYALDAGREQITGQTIFAQGLSGGITDLEFAPDGTLYVITTTQVLRMTPAE